MKQILISIYILLSFLFVSYSPTYAQEEVTDETGNPKDAITLEQAVDDVKTLKDTLDITDDEGSGVKLNFFQILVAILAPLSFIAIAYLLIKRLKL